MAKITFLLVGLCLNTLLALALQADVDGARIIAADSEPGSWLSHGRNYAEDRESPLTAITPDNVNELGLAWYFDTNTTRGLEASPLVIDGVMYSTTSWSEVFAHNAATGELLWHYDPAVPRAWGVNACCDVVNRGVAAWGDHIYVGTIDGRLIALHKDNGEVQWDVLTIDPDKPYTITGAPRAIKGNIVIGNGGAEYGVRGYVGAYDAQTGAQVWRFYTVPGNPAEPYESKTQRMAAATWSGDQYWKSGGGGTVWDSMAFDPALNLLYIGVGNGSPWNRWVRSPGGGDNLFLSSVVALNPDTGAYVWHYQTTPADSWDFTATQHMILGELMIAGESRSVIMQAPKNGFFYVLDRATGELISAEPFTKINWASHVDLATGRPVETEQADHSQQPQTTSPWALGSHNWQPMAFNKATGLVFIPAMEASMPYSTATDFIHKKGGHFNLGQQGDGLKGGDIPDMPAAMIDAIIKKMMRGKLIAWDPIAQRQRWQVQHNTVWNGGVLTTQSGLVFQGTGDQRLVAYSAASGEVLWQTFTGTGIVAPPVSFAIEGEQYIAVMAGWGGTGGLIIPNIVQANGTSRLLVYKLGGSASHPVEPKRYVMKEAPPASIGNAAAIDRGQSLYMANCARCHGGNIGLGGVIPDLRYMNSSTHILFDDIVRGGIYSELGMVSFADVLDEQATQNIHLYLIAAANDRWQQQNASQWWHQLLNWIFATIGTIIGWFMTW